MSKSGSFDWFKLSKLNERSINLQQFSQLIRHSHFGEELSNVPNSLRIKLLHSFQNASKAMKEQFQSEQKIIEECKFQKKVVVQKVQNLKRDLQKSMQKISTDKIVIQEKKKIATKLKQKMKKKHQEKQKKTIKSSQSYFCPFCTRDDFPSRDIFTFHMYKQHASSVNDLKNNQNPSNTITSELKQFVLSLKDKQIELVQMMLNKKKQMETMQLEYAYGQQLKRIRTQANFNDRKSDYLTNYNKRQSDDEQQELKGQSQHLFFQKQRGYDERQTNFYEKRNPQTQRQQYHQIQRQPFRYVAPPEREMVSRSPDYYNIFSSDVAISQNSQSNIPSPNKLELPELRQNHVTKKYNPEPFSMPSSQYLQTPSNNNEHRSHINELKNLSWSPVPATLQMNALLSPQPLRPQFQEQVQSRLYTYTTQNVQVEKQKDKKYETFSRVSKVENVNTLHIFNSGPLMDDDGDGSDFQDYFGNAKHQVEDQVIDEEIVVAKNNRKNEPKKQKQIKFQQQYESVQKPQQNLSIRSYQSNQSQSNVLEYSKDKSLLNISDSKQKSSDLIDLSNSFDKKGMDASKDDTINLSDLKLSKLQKQKVNKSNFKDQQPKVEEMIPSFSRAYENESFISQNAQYFNKNKPNPSILDQFKIQDQEPKYDHYQIPHISRTQKPKNAQNTQKVQQNPQFLKTNPSILDQFFLK